MDSLSIDLLIDRFGKPSTINNTNHGVEYIYFYYDTSTKPKGYDGPRAAAGIVFHFEGKRKMFFAISETDVDL